MKGIILAGGSGTRLYPLTKAISKQLMPVYDKPMVYYPLSTLLQAGIREVLIISTATDLPRFKELLGDGTKIGCKFSYETQDKPRGLADAFIVGERFIGKDKVAMILGDNIFYGTQIDTILKNLTNVDGAIGFAAHVNDAERYGVYEFDKNMNVISIIEKPTKPKSNYANSGLYIYDKSVFKRIDELKPSKRGELEVTDLNNSYIKDKKMQWSELKGFWSDAGTFDSLIEVSNYWKSKTRS